MYDVLPVYSCCRSRERARHAHVRDGRDGSPVNHGLERLHRCAGVGHAPDTDTDARIGRRLEGAAARIHSGRGMRKSVARGGCARVLHARQHVAQQLVKERALPPALLRRAGRRKLELRRVLAREPDALGAQEGVRARKEGQQVLRREPLQRRPVALLLGEDRRDEGAQDEHRALHAVRRHRVHRPGRRVCTALHPVSSGGRTCAARPRPRRRPRARP